MISSVARRMGQVKKLARAGVWIASGAVWALVYVSPGWTWVALASLAALGALSVAAAVAELKAGGRWRGIRRKGGGLGGRGRDDGDGPVGPAVRGWRTLAVVARLMPASAGRRWLAEAQSLLAEVTATRRGAAVRSYLLSAPRLAVMMWARQVLRRARHGPRRPGWGMGTTQPSTPQVSRCLKNGPPAGDSRLCDPLLLSRYVSIGVTMR
jgi:hypothetical protein